MAKLVMVATMTVISVGCTGGPAHKLLTPGTNLVSGREQCIGGDCSAASKKLCVAKGFEEGAAVDVQTEHCLDIVARAVGSCTFVTHAVCR